MFIRSHSDFQRETFKGLLCFDWVTFYFEKSQLKDGGMNGLTLFWMGFLMYVKGMGRGKIPPPPSLKSSKMTQKS